MEGFEKLYSVSRDDESICVMQKDKHVNFSFIATEKNDTKLI